MPSSWSCFEGGKRRLRRSGLFPLPVTCINVSQSTDVVCALPNVRFPRLMTRPISCCQNYKIGTFLVSLSNIRRNIGQFIQTRVLYWRSLLLWWGWRVKLKTFCPYAIWTYVAQSLDQNEVLKIETTLSVWVPLMEKLLCTQGSKFDGFTVSFRPWSANVLRSCSIRRRLYPSVSTLYGSSLFPVDS
jgi:hypothetical protein